MHLPKTEEEPKERLLTTDDEFKEIVSLIERPDTRIKLIGIAAYYRGVYLPGQNLLGQDLEDIASNTVLSLLNGTIMLHKGATEDDVKKALSQNIKKQIYNSVRRKDQRLALQPKETDPEPEDTTELASKKLEDREEEENLLQALRKRLDPEQLRVALAYITYAEKPQDISYREELSTRWIDRVRKRLKRSLKDFPFFTERS